MNQHQQKIGFLSKSPLWPFLLTLVVLVVTKAVFVLIFPPAPPVDANKVELLLRFTRPNGQGLFYDIYDTVCGLFVFLIFLVILYIPWKKCVNSDTFHYSRVSIAHIMLGILAYTTIMVAPYSDTYFRETASDDWFLYVKRPSLVIGWLCVAAIEFLGNHKPNHWTAHVGAFVLSANVFEAAVLCYKVGQYPSGLVLLFIVPFTPMMYVDKDEKLFTAVTDYENFPAFWAFCYRKNPLSVRWYYRLYILALLSVGFLNEYFSTYGLMVLMTLLLPFLTAEVKSFHSSPEQRFKKYTEIFILLRVFPLCINSIYSLAIRDVWFSYFDGRFQEHFTFTIENLYIRNGIDFVFLAGSIIFLWQRDAKEGKQESSLDDDSMKAGKNAGVSFESVENTCNSRVDNDEEQNYEEQKEAEKMGSENSCCKAQEARLQKMEKTHKALELSVQDFVKEQAKSESVYQAEIATLKNELKARNELRSASGKNSQSRENKRKLENFLKRQMSSLSNEDHAVEHSSRDSQHLGHVFESDEALADEKFTEDFLA